MKYVKMCKFPNSDLGVLLLYKIVIYFRLFETHPDIQDVFTPFRGMTKEEMKHSSSLKTHALRVMSAVEKLLARINDMDKVEQLLYEMGQRHMMYNAKVDYIDVSA